jgi:hypothetical protein
MLKRTLLFIMLTLFFGAVNLPVLFAGEDDIDTVHAGIYITSIHDIDFKQKEYTINFWLWLKYKKIETDFLQNLEIPQAKTFVKSFSTIDTSGGKVYVLMKLQCVMKDSWKINNFPFDKQKLRLSIENSQFDSHAMVFTVDTVGKHFDPRFALNGWKISKFDMLVGTKAYETDFGDEGIKVSHTEYSAFKVKLEITRDAIGLFWKMFLGMYVSFLIAYVCCFIHADSIDSRFGLSVGALFAVVGNKYIIDSSLPESVTFTLVDTLHGMTLLAILLVIAFTTISLRLIKQGRFSKSRKLDIIAAQIILVVYVTLNIYFIWKANTV